MKKQKNIDSIELLDKCLITQKDIEDILKQLRIETIDNPNKTLREKIEDGDYSVYHFVKLYFSAFISIKKSLLTISEKELNRIKNKYKDIKSPILSEK